MYCLYVYILFCKKKYDNGILLNSNLTKSGTLTASSSQITKVEIGFKPKYFEMICIVGGDTRVFAYNADYDDSKYMLSDSIKNLATSASVTATNGLYFDDTCAYLYIYNTYPCYWFASK